MIIDFLSETVT